MALVLKTSDVKASVGSNPTLSAHRALVQFGRTLALGARGRRFKSYMPDLEGQTSTIVVKLQRQCLVQSFIQSSKTILKN